MSIIHCLLQATHCVNNCNQTALANKNSRGHDYAPPSLCRVDTASHTFAFVCVLSATVGQRGGPTVQETLGEHFELSCVTNHYRAVISVVEWLVNTGSLDELSNVCWQRGRYDRTTEFEIGGPLGCGCILEQDTSTLAHTGAVQWLPAMVCL